MPLHASRKTPPLAKNGLSADPVPVGFDALPVLDLSNPNFLVEGNRILDELRAKGPICRVEPLGILGFLRWADCDSILRDFKTFSVEFERSQPVPGAEEETKIDTLLREDPPKHTRVRILMQQAFTPQRVAAMESHTREIAHKLIDGIMAGGNECDFLHQFTLPLPSTVMSGLLGVDSSMTETFARWANSMMGVDAAHAIKDKAARQKRYQEIASDAKDMEAFLKEQIEERRKLPQQDLITYLIQAAEGGDRLTEREALTLMKLCLIAGNDLTTQALTLTLDCLLEHPDQMRLLANDLSLAVNAFEESLRFNGPVITLRRKALRDTEKAGVKVPAGCIVAPVVSSANHDELVFENPEVFDLRRKIPRVLSFSSGNHQCIGQALARLEARVAFEEWFARVSSFERKGQPELAKQKVTFVKSFTKLPVAFERRAAKIVTAPEDSVVKQTATAEKLAGMSDQQLGLDKRQIMTVKVAGLWDVSSTVKLFALTHPTGGLLPRFTPGSHIVIHMRDGGKVYRNSYSLINGGYAEGLAYFIAVQLAAPSKGGSKFLHEKVERGSELTISVPANYFPTAEHAVKHLLIAGGIGITPLLAHRSHLRQAEERVELHYAFRSAETAAFVPFLQFQGDPNVHLYDESLGQKLDIPTLIRRQPEGTHVYTCGPSGLMDAAVNAAEALGWPPESIHVERFGAGPKKGDEPFEAECQHSGKTVDVGAVESLLDGLEHAGIEVPFGCRAGSCGTCEVEVLAGEIIHRDSVLSAAERAEGKKMLVCVSRGKGALTLNV
ncbi:cytochrome P450 [Methylobacterium nigriterrae]|uniref:cytochrome P450 n=1 Tax=Methylobacterium nigriterrae TaxID=3127512 RepID=UPI0030132D6B